MTKKEYQFVSFFYFFVYAELKVEYEKTYNSVFFLLSFGYKITVEAALESVVILRNVLYKTISYKNVRKNMP